jgi:hypothetical protein
LSAFEFVKLVLNQLAFGMNYEIFLFFLLCFDSGFDDIGELSFQKFISVHLLKFFEFDVVKRLERVLVVANELTDSPEGSPFSLLILLNVEEPEGSFKNSDVCFVVLEGIIDDISLLEIDHVDRGILDLLVASLRHAY